MAVQLVERPAETKRFFILRARGRVRSDEDARIIGPALEKLADSGVADAKAIVVAARDPKSPLHPYFEWRNNVAAGLWRRREAIELTRNVYVRVAGADGRGYDARAVFSVRVRVESRVAGAPTRVYRRFSDVQADKTSADTVFVEAKGQLVQWAARYGRYRQTLPGFEEQFASVFAQIEALIDGDEAAEEEDVA